MKLWPEQVSALVLESLKKDAERVLQCKVNKAVVTVPAYFNDRQRQATKDAAAIAGLDVPQFLNEPTAAALNYAKDRKANGITEPLICLVFDFGGGTLDISVLEINDTEITTLSTNGDVNLGGADFDSKILELCKEHVKKTRVTDGRPVFDWDSNKGKRARLRLLERCREAKLALVNEV